jgi:hypothetical protein
LLLVFLRPLASGVRGRARQTQAHWQIDFYDCAGLDLDRIRAALPLREGNELSDSDDAVTMIYTHMLNRRGKGVRSPADAL